MIAINRLSKIAFFILLFLTIIVWSPIPECSELLMGQFICKEPEINPNTSQPITCAPGNTILLNCTIIPGLKCQINGTINTKTWFMKKLNNGCTYSTNYSYHTAVTLSVFFGWLGIDRLYLGYYAIAFFKLITFGLFGVFYLLDVILIALQILGPANGEQYFIPHFGPKSTYVGYDNSDIDDQVNCLGCFKGKPEHGEL
uniref:TM2 domain-containing protein n=2 Tax=Strongyloides papillosus TaxID=174720 RepID=A0A0N5CDL5_STREA